MHVIIMCIERLIRSRVPPRSILTQNLVLVDVIRYEKEKKKCQENVLELCVELCHVM